MFFSDGFRLLFLSHPETDNVPLFRTLKERFLKYCRSYALSRDEEIILFLRFEDAQIIPVASFAFMLERKRLYSFSS